MSTDSFFWFPNLLCTRTEKRQPAILCQSRITTACKRALRIHHRRLQKEVPVVKTGVFGAEMEVALINDGPFTIILDSKDLRRHINIIKQIPDM